MSFNAQVHPAFDDDVIEIVEWLEVSSIKESKAFVNAVYDEINATLSELDRQIFQQHQRAIKSRAAGKFKNHFIYYTVDKTTQSMMVLAVLYAGRNPELIDQILGDRLKD